MRNYSLITIFLLLLTGCSIETSDNGVLDGRWQLMEINYFDGSNRKVETKEQLIFWDIQYKLISIHSMSGKLHDSLTEESLCRFNYTKDSLKLSDFYRHFREADQKIDDPLTTYFQKTGINGINANFAVLHLDSKSMLLQSDYAKLSFRKF
ncbi:lipocalin-like domain-containing protein [uncultured Alloprevotella sp.]|uniref:lipocalin-like domain-containing protein n=1 Tax=uncultured Alloprevotella sp. TaxID=1283315 RepID=UPI0026254491|nr:lipocalin-like domain-containing protein [uncultured Alloprevotella sp.]